MDRSAQDGVFLAPSLGIPAGAMDMVGFVSTFPYAFYMGPALIVLDPKMIGIVVVAALAPSVATMLPGVAITATCRRTRSAIKAGRASSRPSSQWYSIVTFWPSR
jgi:hypothetical protein